VIGHLFEHILGVARKMSVTTISLAMLESNPVIPVLKKSGYVLMPQRTSVVVHVHRGMESSEILKMKDMWFMTVGDRDV